MVATTLQYGTFRLRIVTYREDLSVSTLYISRSEWRFYSEAYDTV